MPKANIEREIVSANLMFSTARASQYLANESEDESLKEHHTLVGLVFTAFSIEAAINHYGVKLFATWSELEKLPPISKLKVIFEHLDLEYDSSKGDEQLAEQLFRFRNEMAHGKTTELSGQVKVKKPFAAKDFVFYPEKLLPTKWERFCNPENLEKAIFSAISLCNKIEDKSGLQEQPLHRGGLVSITTTEA